MHLTVSDGLVSGVSIGYRVQDPLDPVDSGSGGSGSDGFGQIIDYSKSDTLDYLSSRH